ncbi:MAG TPA: hypothetical protein VF109_05300 [Mycobacteriales bacterium]
MADSTEHESNRVTSGRRALIAAWVRQATDLPALYAAAWADACAALVEDGWPTAARSLLTRQLDPADVDRAGRALLGGIPPTPDELTRRRLQQASPELPAPGGPMPTWATIGVRLPDEVVFARPTLDLDAAEAADARQWPPVTVAAYQTTGSAPCVLVEVGAGGPPTRFEPGQARRLSAALLDAADVVDSIGRAQP